MRVLSFIILCIIGFLGPIQVFLFGVLLYVFIWSSYELLIITLCIDVLFGTTSTSFVYTISTGILLIASELLRPYLSWYTSQT